jgi:hypothetical protein
LLTPGTVGRCNLDGDGGRSSKKPEPFVIVQHPTIATTGEAALLVVVVDFVAISVQIFAEDRCAAVVACIGKSRGWALTKKRTWEIEENE